MMKLNKNWLLAGLLAVMLVVAGWEYGQIKQQANVAAVDGFPCAGHIERDECVAQDGCRWQRDRCSTIGNDRPPNQCPPGTHSNGNCEDGVLRPPCCEMDVLPSPSPSLSPSPSVYPSPSASPNPSASPHPSPSMSPVPSSSPSLSPSPSVYPSPSVSPNQSASPQSGHAVLVIRKFKDDDKDGNWDNGETSTGKEWQFQYRISSDPWQDYTTSSETGWGGTVEISRGTKVEVREVEQSGWTNTTGLTLIKILDEAKTYYFDFGNFENPGVVTTADLPARTPDTGRSSQWQMWIILGAIGIGLQALAILL